MIGGHYDSRDKPADNTPDRVAGAMKQEIANEVLTLRLADFSISRICFSPSPPGESLGVLRFTLA